MWGHAKERTFSCSFCHRRFASKVLLDNHSVIHESDLPFECLLCKKRYPLKIKFIKHIKKCNAGIKRIKMESDSDFYVDECKKGRSESQKKRIVAACKLCSQSFRRKCALERHHLMSHTKKRPFTCPFCVEKFKFRRKLVNHMKCHSLNRKYSCKLCRGCFTTKYRLRSHTSTHLNEDDRKVTKEAIMNGWCVCCVCKSVFKTAALYLDHIVMHAKVKWNHENLAQSMFDDVVTEFLPLDIQKSNVIADEMAQSKEEHSKLDPPPKVGINPITKESVKVIKNDISSEPISGNELVNSRASHAILDIFPSVLHDVANSKKQRSDSQIVELKDGSSFLEHKKLIINDCKVLKSLDSNVDYHNMRTKDDFLEQKNKTKQFHEDKLMLSKSNEELFSCHLCERTFSSESSLTRHLLSHRRRATFPAKNYAKLASKRFRRRNASSRNSHMCIVCKEEFHTCDSFFDHIPKHNSIRWEINEACMQVSSFDNVVNQFKPSTPSVSQLNESDETCSLFEEYMELSISYDEEFIESCSAEETSENNRHPVLCDTPQITLPNDFCERRHPHKEIEEQSSCDKVAEEMEQSSCDKVTKEVEKSSCGTDAKEVEQFLSDKGTKEMEQSSCVEVTKEVGAKEMEKFSCDKVTKEVEKSLCEEVMREECSTHESVLPTIENLEFSSPPIDGQCLDSDSREIRIDRTFDGICHEADESASKLKFTASTLVVSNETFYPSSDDVDSVHSSKDVVGSLNPVEEQAVKCSVVPLDLLHACGICQTIFKNEYHLDLHYEIFHPRKDVCVCPLCDIRFDAESLLDRHKNRHPKRRYKADLFQKRFLSLNVPDDHYKRLSHEITSSHHTLANVAKNPIKFSHLMKCHPKTAKTPKKLFSCIICKKVFTRMMFLQHVQMHSCRKSIVCSLCHNIFPSRLAYHKHYISHIRKRTHQRASKAKLDQLDPIEKKSLCVNGNEECTTKNVYCRCAIESKIEVAGNFLKDTAHLEEGSFVCDACDRSFISRSHLALHKESVHTNVFQNGTHHEVLPEATGLTDLEVGCEPQLEIAGKGDSHGNEQVSISVFPIFSSVGDETWEENDQEIIIDDEIGLLITDIKTEKNQVPVAENKVPVAEKEILIDNEIVVMNLKTKNEVDDYTEDDRIVDVKGNFSPNSCEWAENSIGRSDNSVIRVSEVDMKMSNCHEPGVGRSVNINSGLANASLHRTDDSESIRHAVLSILPMGMKRPQLDTEQISAEQYEKSVVQHWMRL